MIQQIFGSLSSFKDLEFKSGLNVLVAQKEAGASDKQTRNRAGKTSLVEIIHFLTGADAGKDSLFRSDALANESFGMAFDLGGEAITIERSGHQKAKIHVEGPDFLRDKTQLSNSEWVELLGEKMFGLDSLSEVDGRGPKFRSLFAYFVRRQTSVAFTTPEKQAAMQQTGDYQIALLYLLGLDWKIASDWQKVRDREKTLKELKKAAGAGAFGNIIGKASDLRTKVTVSEAALQEMQSHLADFRVLPEYAQMEAEADELTRRINRLSNGNVIDAAAIRDLEQAMASEAPPPLDELEASMQKQGLSFRDWQLSATTRCAAFTSRLCGTVATTSPKNWIPPSYGSSLGTRRSLGWSTAGRKS